MEWKKVIIFSLLLSTSLQAQGLPDRNNEIRNLVRDKYQSMFDGTDDTGRVITGLICNDLNIIDNGNWGQLIKNDRNPPFIPYDILVWKPTKEHVDILTSNGSVWIPHPVIPLQWSWIPCANSVPTQQPIDFNEIIRRQAVLENELLIIKSEGRETKAIAQEAVKEIKEHRTGVQAVWTRVAAIAGPIITGITVWLQTRE